ncbi:carboxypeptidase family protein [Pontibacter ummariensis]|uniref:Carboxypeptidase regulatory-like domain-containing protein n=2 Tax=Pontibacter ummariensis TaxID=1610492 RepID=A0A239E2S9_9BACT|nr:carboxypeptidase family protein [Pontibacter ummariensis]SNS38588.1 Carboxypeptidase regulatory-like domain-containing protein [Pontibacter ummariensis]
MCLILAMVLMVQYGWAQGSTTAAMNGKITDESGSGLPGATVIAVHTPTNTQYVAGTNADGRYNFQNMRVGGPYTIKTSYVGYQEQRFENITLKLGQNLNLDIKLTGSNVSLGEVEIVSRKDNVINADRTGAATNVARDQIEKLPTLSRSLQDYTRLTPQANGNSFGGRNSGYNNTTIDGALFNNSFGLQANVGSQTGAQPISLDAIEQIQVNLAPYDVRQGGFTGAGINAVTRSGTNDFSGSVYWFGRNESLVGRNVGDTKMPKQEFSLSQRGARIGGPILKDKLFFFVNYEEERITSPGSNLIAKRDGLSGSNVSNVEAATLDQLSKFLKDKFGYETGPYEGYNMETYNDKVNAKIDWNINKNHTFSFKYNYLKSWKDIPASNSGAPNNNRQASITGLPFKSSIYVINNNLNSYIGELNSRFGDKFANNLIVGYTAFRDFRESPGGIFPLVDIENGSGSSLTAFGYEPFTANNRLDSDVYQFSDNFSIFAGKHVITVGTSNEAYKFINGFAPNYYGRYRFASVEDFYNSVNNGVSNAKQYQLQYSALPGGEFPFAEIKAMQLGFYAQDEWSVLNNLKLTGGIRADLPIFNSDLLRNEQVEGMTFRNGEKIDVSQLPETKVLWSPRFGFNWDVKGDATTQVRGGTGIFTGRVPFVWISNQASNNGVLFGSFTEDNPTGRPFTSDVTAYIPTNAAASSRYNLAVTAKDFKFPQVFRSNLAVDQELPFGVVATFEAIYTKDVNSVYHKNVNLPNAATTAKGADNRPIFYQLDSNGNLKLNAKGFPTANNKIYSGNPADITDAIVMENSSKGYSYTLTGQLQKSFASGLFGSIAYTYADSRSVNDGGSIAQSIWRDRQVSGDPNAEALSYSNYLTKHRAILALSYKKEYFKHLSTSISTFFEASSGYRFSYTYTGDINGDGQSSNDLIYVPLDASEIVLVPVTYPTGSTLPADTRDAAVVWNQLDAYIKQDEYLNSRRGQYAERNGAETPWTTRMDVRLLQDLFTDIAGKKNTLQLSVDVFNFGNLLNKDWGVVQMPNTASLLKYEGYTADGKPKVSFPYLDPASQTPLSKTFRDNTGESSRWRAQVGVRYIFN